MLDVSIQKQILQLIRKTCEERHLAVILVTHDMGVIAETADRVIVMRHGRRVEDGPTREVLSAPKMAYTKELIAAIPRIEDRVGRFTNFGSAASAEREIDGWLKQGGRLAGDTVYLRVEAW
ncbi:MAG: hypothetical protein V3R90_16605 [Limibaculum sp.]